MMIVCRRLDLRCVERRQIGGDIVVIAFRMIAGRFRRCRSSDLRGRSMAVRYVKRGQIGGDIAMIVLVFNIFVSR